MLFTDIIVICKHFIHNIILPLRKDEGSLDVKDRLTWIILELSKCGYDERYKSWVQHNTNEKILVEVSESSICQGSNESEVHRSSTQTRKLSVKKERGHLETVEMWIWRKVTKISRVPKKRWSIKLIWNHNELLSNNIESKKYLFKETSKKSLYQTSYTVID